MEGRRRAGAREREGAALTADVVELCRDLIRIDTSNHGHLDVVPAEPSDWKVHPFAGEVEDGCVWGRGAVDMKDMVAMTLKTAVDFRTGGVVPPRDLIFCFLADEEAGGLFGSKWIVEAHPELFEGATEA